MVWVMADIEPARAGRRGLSAGAIAENLCVVIFQGRKVKGRYRMTFDDMAAASKLPYAEVVSGLTAGIKQDWITQIHDTIELKAAGIHVAKKSLDLLG